MPNYFFKNLRLKLRISVVIYGENHVKIVFGRTICLLLFEGIVYGRPLCLVPIEKKRLRERIRIFLIKNLFSVFFFNYYTNC